MRVFIIFLLVFVYSGDLSSQYYLGTVHPDNPWTLESSSITNAEYVIKTDKNFVTCDLYMTYNCDVFYYQPTFGYEVKHKFFLPENVLVTDSWLWVDTFIMKAKILERSEAINYYETIVQRRVDPSLLLKNPDNSYDFSIYPIFNKSSRRVKLSFILPIDQNLSTRSFTLPLSPLLSSREKNEVIIKIADTQNYDLSTEEGQFLEMENDSILGIVYKTKFVPKSEEFVILIKNDTTPVKISYAYDEQVTPTGGFYQVSLDVSKEFKLNNHISKNVLVLIEHDSLLSFFSKPLVKKQVDYFIKNYLQSGDSLQILYNDNTTKHFYPGFIPVKNLDNYGAILDMKLGNFSNIPSSLFEAYQALQGRSNPVLVIISSSGNLTSGAVAQALKNELVLNYGTLPKTFVHSYTNYYAQRYWTNGRSYQGNDFFYSVITSNSGGYFNYAKNGIKILAEWFPYWKEFGTNFDILTQKPFEIQYTFNPHDGLTYDNHIIKNNTREFKMVGRFAGTMPLKMNAIVWVDNEIVQYNRTFEIEEESPNLQMFKQTHYGHKILNLERTSTIQKANIIDISIKNRVLSLYTAFLALEPGLQDPCINCVDESSTSTEDFAESVQWKIYPNPFTDKVFIELTGLADHEIPREISFFNMRGEKETAEINFSKEGEKWLIEVHAFQIPAGVYFLKVNLGNRMLTCKLVKV